MERASHPALHAMHTQRSAIDTSHSNEDSQLLHLALVGGLRTPLAALRASMETLVHRFEERDPRLPQIAASLAQVVHLQHNLQSIVDAEHPTALRPLSCTLHELVASAVNALVPDQRARVLVAVEDGDARIHVDGPLVSRSLMRLLECGLDARSDAALLRVRTSAGRASFAILHSRFDTPEGSIEELVTRVAARDAQRMDGTFEMRAGVLELGFDLAVAGEEAA